MCRGFGGDYRVVGVYDPTTDRIAIIRPLKDEYGQWTGRQIVRCRNRELIRDNWDEAIAAAYRLAGRR